MPKSRKPNIESKKIQVNPSAVRLVQPHNAYLHKTAPDIHCYSLNPYLDDKSTANLSNSCVSFSLMYQPNLNKRALEKLLQAVIDDDRTIVKKILDLKPEHLLLEPSDLKIKQIESKKTWQRFITEKPFVMALKRNQIEMVKVILPYFDKLEDGKAEALKQWQSQEEKQPNFNEMLQPLINIIARENCANGVMGPLSEETEAALTTFRETLLPDKAVRLNDYFDIEQFLLVARSAYNANFNTFQTWNQRDVFCIRLIGFLQGLVSPEFGKIFCEGLYYVVEENRKISARAENLKLLGGESFYRESRLSTTGQGFGFVAAGTGCRADGLALLSTRFEKLYRAKAAGLGELKKRLHVSAQQQGAEPLTSQFHCVIS